MENGEKVIISGRAKPKINLLVIGIICIIAGIVILVSDKSQRPDDITITKIGAILSWFAALVGLRFFFKSRKSNITVTSKCITGATAWGNTVNLPLNQVDSAAIDATGALIISTYSGKTIFAKMDNTPQIFAEINNLLIGRQSVMKSSVR